MTTMIHAEISDQLAQQAQRMVERGWAANVAARHRLRAVPHLRPQHRPIDPRPEQQRVERPPQHLRRHPLPDPRPAAASASGLCRLSGVRYVPPATGRPADARARAASTRPPPAPHPPRSTAGSRPLPHHQPRLAPAAAPDGPSCPRSRAAAAHRRSPPDRAPPRCSHSAGGNPTASPSTCIDNRRCASSSSRSRGVSPRSRGSSVLVAATTAPLVRPPHVNAPLDLVDVAPLERVQLTRPHPGVREEVHLRPPPLLDRVHQRPELLARQRPLLPPLRPPHDPRRLHPHDRIRPPQIGGDVAQERAQHPPPPLHRVRRVRLPILPADLLGPPAPLIDIRARHRSTYSSPKHDPSGPTGAGRTCSVDDMPIVIRGAVPVAVVVPLDPPLRASAHGHPPPRPDRRHRPGGHLLDLDPQRREALASVVRQAPVGSVADRLTIFPVRGCRTLARTQ
jgi:hypothetical protein